MGKTEKLPSLEILLHEFKVPLAQVKGVLPQERYLEFLFGKISATKYPDSTVDQLCGLNDRDGLEYVARRLAESPDLGARGGSLILILDKLGEAKQLVSLSLKLLNRREYALSFEAINAALNKRNRVSLSPAEVAQSTGIANAIAPFLSDFEHQFAAYNHAGNREMLTKIGLKHASIDPRLVVDLFSKTDMLFVATDARKHWVGKDPFSAYEFFFGWKDAEGLSFARPELIKKPFKALQMFAGKGDTQGLDMVPDAVFEKNYEDAFNYLNRLGYRNMSLENQERITYPRGLKIVGEKFLKENDAEKAYLAFNSANDINGIQKASRVLARVSPAWLYERVRMYNTLPEVADILVKAVSAQTGEKPSLVASLLKN